MLSIDFLLLLALIRNSVCRPLDWQITEIDINLPEGDSSGAGSAQEAELFHGDILLTETQKNALGVSSGDLPPNNDDPYGPQNAVVPIADRLWSNKTVYFTITESAREKKTYNAIMEAMDQFQQKSCIKFVERTTQPDYVVFTKNTRCSSFVGRIGGPQPISIGTGCEIVGIVMHEIFHALGRWHEHSRPDRDNYVTIHLENVQSNHHKNFATLAIAKTQDVPYDYMSLMHYSAYAFSKNGLPSIVPKTQVRTQLGQRRGFTKKDLEHVRKLYQCSEADPDEGPWGQWSECSKLCGSGNRTRVRQCGGHVCTEETVECNTKQCLQDVEDSPLKLLDEEAPELSDNALVRSEPINRCRKVAEQKNFAIFAVAAGFCISGSNNITDYTTTKSDGCSNGKGGYSSSLNVEFYMNVYQLVDITVGEQNSSLTQSLLNILLPSISPSPNPTPMAENSMHGGSNILSNNSLSLTPLVLLVLLTIWIS